ncbi:unnamed protein product [Caenorhabditis angaria]|uniref:SXP/RAL-2 family protein Ani s 5-like cation-binding domain-containing protein n=1 Tax=Caenorhabditis angaria TaxID=860376 RepID=A0A9P1IEZ0_9PELO|nr:unnamed protein product [Caenorhabditis angaria]
MLNTLIICIFFVIRINAGVIPTSFNITEELDKISKDCLTNAEHHELTGNKYKGHLASFLDWNEIELSVYIIGNSEIRKALGFGPPGPWNNETFPSDERLNAASNLEEYFKLQTTSSVSFSARVHKITEKDFETAIRYLDKRLPGTRLIYRKKVEEFMRDHKTINRKMVDDLTDYIYEIFEKLRDATEEMRWNIRCRLKDRRDYITSYGIFSSLLEK